jgi:hypothetical protein
MPPKSSGTVGKSDHDYPEIDHKLRVDQLRRDGSLQSNLAQFLPTDLQPQKCETTSCSSRPAVETLLPAATNFVNFPTSPLRNRPPMKRRRGWLGGTPRRTTLSCPRPGMPCVGASTVIRRSLFVNIGVSGKDVEHDEEETGGGV